ncbi:hypothetical protein fsci_12780 [Francisella sciaenopsi]|uniref:Uncharacterized protein n=1 Tax=Francisella sciaenopsi TaxID=3055034 RepID=A0ABQ6PH04_9GAMM
MYFRTLDNKLQVLFSIREECKTKNTNKNIKTYLYFFFNKLILLLEKQQSILKYITDTIS